MLYKSLRSGIACIHIWEFRGEKGSPWPWVLLFHKFVLLWFLTLASTLYLVLRPMLGRIAAAGAIALMVFNPFAALWIGVSSSDSVGMMLNLLALICFILGLRGSFHIPFLGAFGFLLACASLTRPLMNPFILPAILFLVVLGHIRWQRRVVALLVMLLFFAMPTFLWMSTLRVISGSWALAGHEASTFYAASDPKYQVWTRAMYQGVVDSAKKQFHTDNVSASQLEEEYAILARGNYVKYFDYHAQRIFPHALELAGFTYFHPKRVYTYIRLLIWGIILVMLVGEALYRNRKFAAVSIAIVGGVLAIFAEYQALVILAYAVSSLFLLFKRRPDSSLLVFPWFWWVGVGALFLVGGTWGPPLTPVADVSILGIRVASRWYLNALGFRLGSQFFFALDIMMVVVLAAMSRIETLDVKHNEKERLVFGRSAQNRWTKNSPRISQLISSAIGGWVVLTIAILVFGSCVVGYRSWLRSSITPVAIPTTTPVLKALRSQLQAAGYDGDLELVAGVNEAYQKIGWTNQGAKASEYVAFFGGMSDFLWNMQGQERAHALLYLQSSVVPFGMEPNHVCVEFSEHLPVDKWCGRQGLWVIRRFEDLRSESTLPYYYSEAAVRAFVPLSADHREFDFSSTENFSLRKYASQLAADGSLQVIKGKIVWDYTSGSEQYPRRFRLEGDSAIVDHELVIDLDVSRAKGEKTLSFGWRLVEIPGEAPSIQQLRIDLVGIPNTATRKGTKLLYSKVIDLFSNSSQERQVMAQISDPEIGKVKIRVSGIVPPEALWIHELNLRASEFLSKPKP